jgi:hypothetical protein
MNRQLLLQGAVGAGLLAATTEYLARNGSQQLGRIGSIRRLGPLRDALVAHVRSHGFGRDV